MISKSTKKVKDRKDLTIETSKKSSQVPKPAKVKTVGTSNLKRVMRLMLPKKIRKKQGGKKTLFMLHWSKIKTNLKDHNF